MGAYYGRGIVYQRMGIQVILKISLKFSHLIISTCKRIPINFASKCMIMLTVKCKTETLKCELKYFCFENKEIANAAKSVREFTEAIMKDENHHEIYERRAEVCLLNYSDTH